MKYWNKSKKYREAKWHLIKLPTNTSRWLQFKMKQWCQQQEGKGRFYWSPHRTLWYFENEQDAVLFALRWT